jgi:hypothetical protein
MLELFVPQCPASSRMLLSTNVQRRSYRTPHMGAAGRSSIAATKVRKSQVPQSVEAL